MGRVTINPYEKGPKKSLKKDIKTQDKEIEITSNGTTEVTPDEGFTYLNSVSVKTNVAQSGVGSNYLYYDQKQTLMNYKRVWQEAVLLKIEAMGLKLIGTPFYCYKLFESAPEGVDLESSIVAVCIDPNLRIATPDFNGTLEEVYGDDFISHIKEEVSITEEEFYSL